MGYVVPPRPGEPSDPEIDRLLRWQITTWIVGAPLVIISVVAILYVATFR